MKISFSPGLARRARIIGAFAVVALASGNTCLAAEIPSSQRTPTAFSRADSERLPPAEEPLWRLLAEALKTNPELAAARSEREAAEQRISPAGALEDPMVEAGVLNLPLSSVSFSREDMTMKMLGLSQRLPYPGQRALKRDVATLDAESVGHAFNETANRVLRDTTLAYYDLGLVEVSARLVMQNRDIVQQLVKVANSRYSVGQGNQVDVLRAQAQLSKISEELIKLDRDRVASEAELTRLLGGSRSSPMDVPPRVSMVERELALTTLREQAWQRRPQLLALKAIAERGQRSLELARKERYPDFDVRVSYGQRENMPDGSRRSDMVSVTVAMNLPVWRQTKTIPRIAEAVAMQEQAENMYRAQRSEIDAKLRQQMASAEQSLRAARLYRTEIIPQSRLTIEAAMAAYQVGRTDFALLLDNQMSVLNFQLAESAAIVSYNKALAEIDFLTGRIADSVVTSNNVGAR